MPPPPRLCIYRLPLVEVQLRCGGKYCSNAWPPSAYTLTCCLLHLAAGLDTDAFLLSLWRFITRYGTPFKMLCDNGPNFDFPTLFGETGYWEKPPGAGHMSCSTRWRGGRFPSDSFPVRTTFWWSLGMVGTNREESTRGYPPRANGTGTSAERRPHPSWRDSERQTIYGDAADLYCFHKCV